MDELVAVLRARHPTSLEQLPLPALRRLADRLESSVAKVVLSAIERIDDPPTRHAARELVPMPYGSRIAPTLTDRRISAARSFGQSGNYFRSGPSDRSKPSTESLVLTAIATAIAADQDNDDQPTAVSPAPEPSKIPEGGSGSIVPAGRDRGAVILLILTGSLALAGIVVWVLASQTGVEAAANGQSFAAGELPARCHRLGSGKENLRRGFRFALGEVRVDPSCPVDEVELFEGMSYQRVAGTGAHRSWVVLLRPDGRFLAFPWTAWERYRTVAETGMGFDGFGLPSTWQETIDLAELRLDGGGTIASENSHGLYFLIHPAVDRLWHDHADELGAPFSSGMTTRRQEFAGGYVELENETVSWVPVPKGLATQALPQRSDRAEAVILQTSDIAWWVDSADRRWSIRSDGVEECLGGQAAVADDAVPGYAIAQLELAGVADCSLASG